MEARRTLRQGMTTLPAPRKGHQAAPNPMSGITLGLTMEHRVQVYVPGNAIAVLHERSEVVGIVAVPGRLHLWQYRPLAPRLRSGLLRVLQPHPSGYRFSSCTA